MASLSGKNVCAACLNDDYLVRWVRESSQHGDCSYCDETGPTRRMDELLSLVRDGFEHEYGEANDEGLIWDSEDKTFGAGAMNSYDLVWGDHAFTEHPGVADDIIRALPDQTWCEREPYEASHYERLSWGWSFFQSHILHECRFFFHDAVEPSDEPGPKMSVKSWLRLLTKMVAACDMIRELPAGARLWRARISAKGEKYAEPGELGPPRLEKATQTHRMSPAGIPVFYGALDEVTPIQETYQPERGPAMASLALFRTAKPLRVVDLTRIPAFPSLFDPRRREQRNYIRFLREFAEQIAKPIARDDRVHVDYIPTQVVAEYLRMSLKPPVQGILFGSARRAGGTCVALFIKNSDCRPASETCDEGVLLLEAVSHQELRPGPSQATT